MRIAVVILFTAACAAFGAEIRNIYLPPWYEKDDMQPVRLNFRAPLGATVKVTVPCTVCALTNIIAVTNSQSSVLLFVDLKKTQSPFTVTLWSQDPKGHFSTPCAEFRCHLSLLPMRYQVSVRDHQFTITNLSREPLALEEIEKATVEHSGPDLISGRFAEGAVLKLKGDKAIHLTAERREK